MWQRCDLAKVESESERTGCWSKGIIYIYIFVCNFCKQNIYIYIYSPLRSQKENGQ